MTPNDPSSKLPSPAIPSRGQMSIYALAALACLAIGLATSLIIALSVIGPERNWQGKTLINVQGALAAQEAKAIPTPHTIPWPPPTHWTESQSFAHLRYDYGHAEGNQSTHAIIADLYGWPRPCLMKAQFWWPWNDPKWATTASDETGVRFLRGGLLLDTLFFATIAALLLFGPHWVRRAVRAFVAMRRLRKRQCPACGYPTGSSPICSECGASVTPVYAPPSGQ